MATTIQSHKGKEWYNHGLTLTVGLQQKYQTKEKAERVKSASMTIHSELTPKEIVEIIKRLLCKQQKIKIK